MRNKVGNKSYVTLSKLSLQYMPNNIVYRARNRFINDCSTSIGLAPVYGFLEPQAIHCAKDKRTEYEQYIANWVKESHREVYLGPYLNQ